SLDPNAKFVVLKPESWVGQTLPVLDYIESPVELRKGKWLVVLYRPDCIHCQALLPLLKKRFDGGRDEQRLALIDISGVQQADWLVENRIASGRLAPNKTWLLTPPVGMILSEGRVD